MNSLNELRTARMLLRRMCADDLDDLACMHRDPVVMATLGGVRDESVVRERLQLHLTHWEQHGFGWWTFREPETLRFMGRGGLRRMPVNGRDEVELGYGLMTEFWGRGLATEMARESVRIAFEVLRLPEMICFALPFNRASRHVMEKVGFRYERDGEYAELPHVFYRLTAQQWREANSA
jgi:RimJ/RimL family protein N-acetyltransferase